MNADDLLPLSVQLHYDLSLEFRRCMENDYFLYEKFEMFRISPVEQRRPQ